MQPLLSILVPTWNRRKDLEALLHLLREQMDEVCDVELLVSSNGSTDSTEEVLRALDKEPRIRVFRQPNNLGASIHIAWLYGQATGKFLWLIGDDDLIEEGALKRVCDVLRASPEIGWLHLPGVIYVTGRDAPLEMLCPKADVKAAKARDLFSEYNHWVGWVTGNVVATALIQKELPKVRFWTSWWPWELLMRAVVDHPAVVLSERLTVAGADMTWKSERAEILTVEMPQMLLGCSFLTPDERNRMFCNLYTGESLNNLAVLLRRKPGMALRILKTSPSLIGPLAGTVFRMARIKLFGVSH